ncbi:MAG: ribonuclease III domain-containing protein, partial [Paeniclostridium sordellii]|nr:ribonuclease III domain-containing protein [Paeniclostridium sordellii]
MKIKSSILNNISKFEEIINYKFKNKAYILEALTHSSYSNENKSYAFNERLEFLGDSVLGIVVSDFLFKNETELPEGELTKLRANIVCEESLSDVAKHLNLGKHILLGRGEEATGGRDRVSILADAFEAV